tara:strand:+ start:529 stop:807 length:279 start_codon:yes stop_codon:yes gene_type:complete
VVVAVQQQTEEMHQLEVLQDQVEQVLQQIFQVVQQVMLVVAVAEPKQDLLEQHLMAEALEQLVHQLQQQQQLILEVAVEVLETAQLQQAVQV